ncbi:uncharacterized protein N7479_008130 [Penicillium vulpinum]|uniref:uncharacterized protein n=1 Tax=Penicillium vulpinum TaxID=29845 RepID=UPI0025471A66|nr:uncharacterized protein N7479_008130 [Penicillium vulpinum]KAJ5960980.1 hypothetical protein N7479_008130 [Penicillium vulpinum]
MKITLAAILVGCAAFVAAIPVSLQGKSVSLTMERREPANSQLHKRAGYDGKIVDSANYILVLFEDDADAIDPYQDEVDAVQDPADVLG